MNAPLWIIAIAAAILVSLALGFSFCCVGTIFYSAHLERQRKQELLRREPWRRFE